MGSHRHRASAPLDVLAIDDETLVLSALSRALAETLDVTVTVTTDPHEALSLLEQRAPKVLITDFCMPVVDGVTILREARRLAPDTVRILLTARAEQAHIIDAINVGRIFRFIAKPWENEELAAIVREAMEVHELVTRPHAESLDAELERKSLRMAVQRVRELQRSAFLDDPVRLVGSEVACFGAPCEYATGDYLDLVPLTGNRRAILLGDVAGHGVDAALVGFAARSLLRSGLVEEDGVPDALERANRALCRDLGGGRFLTLFVAIHDLEQRTLTYVNAGQLPPLLLASGEVTELTRTGLPLGLADDASYRKTRTVPFADGDTLFAYTDGLTEARNAAGELFGAARLRGCLECWPAVSPTDLVTGVRTAVAAFVGDARTQDDLSLLAYRCTGTGRLSAAPATLPVARARS